MCILEDKVREVVQDFIQRGCLFTALDVSNVVKQTMPQAHHKEVRNAVRKMYANEIEPQGWMRTPITVLLEDSTTAQALLYHNACDSFDLDNKYDTQKRAATSFKPVAAAQACLAQAQLSLPNIPAPPPAPAISAPVPNPISQWDQMFQNQPSLFPSGK